MVASYLPTAWRKLLIAAHSMEKLLVLATNSMEETACIVATHSMEEVAAW